MARMYVPTITPRCADCDFGTITGGERYVVKDETWLHAWGGRLKPWHALPGQQVLCVGCLEARIGRTLMACDFTDAPINDPDTNVMSERLRARVCASEGHTVGGIDGLLKWMVSGMLAKLPPEKQARSRESWRAIMTGKLTLKPIVSEADPGSTVAAGTEVRVVTTAEVIKGLPPKLSTGERSEDLD